MEYLKVRWLHDNPNEPIELYSELDEDRNEIRKIEIFRNGDFGYASATTSKEPTMLSLEPLPQNTEIAADPQFEILETSKSTFEQLWLKAIKA